MAHKTIWNSETFRDLERLMKAERPAVVHVHNTLPVVSPAVYYSARAAGVPVVQTLHNYRILCAGATLFRAGQVCEACISRVIAAPAVRHACYRGSRAASAAVATMTGVHWLLGTWTRRVDLFLALSDFARRKFIEGGLPADKVRVKPNFTGDPAVQAHPGDYALFVGRLSPEKGIGTLLKAWEHVGTRIRLRVIGDGPQRPLVEAAAQANHAIEYLGSRDRSEVIAAMQGARFLVFPSEWYETFGLAIIEAYAVGIPVVASELGVMASLVSHQATGLHFRAGDSMSLVAQLEWALDHPDRMRAMGKAARREYEARYTPETNYRLLMDVYGTVTGSPRDGTATGLGDEDVAARTLSDQPPCRRLLVAARPHRW